MKKKALIILLAIAGSIGVAAAQTPKVIVSDSKGWHKIGETIVDFKRDKDVVTVLGADNFAKIKFMVDKEAIHLMDVEVFFENGESQKVTLNSPIKSHGESRIVDLNGGERSIKKIEFVYKTFPNGKDEKAHVEIWGYKSNADKDK